MQGNRRALVIGSGKYDDPRLVPLTSEKEVEELASILRDPDAGNYVVEEPILNKPAREVGIRIENFCKKCESSDLLLIYISCHGLKDDALELFFAMSDTSVDNLEHTTVSAISVCKFLNRSRARQKVLLLDCCFSGAFPSGNTAMAAGEQIGLQTTLVGKGIQILASSSEMQYSFIGEIGENKERRSYFTKALIEGLRGNAAVRNQKDVSVENLFKYISRRIKEYPTERNQTPKIMGEKDSEIIISRNPLFRQSVGFPSELYSAVERADWDRAAALLQTFSIDETGDMRDIDKLISILILANETAEIDKNYIALNRSSSLLAALAPGKRFQEVQNRIHLSNLLEDLWILYVKAKEARKLNNLPEAKRILRLLLKKDKDFEGAQKLQTEVEAELDALIEECETRIQGAISNSRWKEVFAELFTLKTLRPADKTVEDRVASLESRLQLPQLYEEAEELARVYDLAQLRNAENILGRIIDMNPYYRGSKTFRTKIRKEIDAIENSIIERRSYHYKWFILGWVIVGSVFGVSLFYLNAGFWAKEGYENGFSMSILYGSIATLGFLLLHVFYKYLSDADLEYRKGKIFSLLGFLLLPAFFAIGQWIIPYLQHQASLSDMKSAKRLIDDKKYAEAEKLVKTLFRRGYKEHDAYHLLARTYSKRGFFSNACQTEHDAIRANNESVNAKTDMLPEYFFDAGLDCLRASDPEARRFFKRVRALWPDDPDVLLKYAQNYLAINPLKAPAQDDFVEARDSLLYAVNLIDNSSVPESFRTRAKEILPELYRELGNTYRFTDTDTSLAFFAKSLEINESPLTYRDRALVFLDKKQPDHAFNDAERAVNLSNTDIDLLNFRLECLMEKKDYLSVVAAFDAIPQKNAVTYLRKGIALYELNRLDEALVALDLAAMNDLTGNDQISLGVLYKFKALAARKRFYDLCTDYKRLKPFTDIETERNTQILELGTTACKTVK